MLVICTNCLNEIEIPLTPQEYMDYQRSGELIQRALPQLTADERELLISGTCGPCFDAMFADRD